MLAMGGLKSGKESQHEQGAEDLKQAGFGHEGILSLIDIDIDHDFASLYLDYEGRGRFALASGATNASGID